MALLPGGQITASGARSIAFVAGATLFGWILYRMDLHAVWIQLQAIQWRFVWIVLVYGIILALNTFGWRFALVPHERSKVGWGALFRIRLAGQALNVLTPAASMGGEPVKAWRLSQYGVPIADAMASVVTAKTTFVFAMLFFSGIGLAITLATQSVSDALLRSIWIVMPGVSIALALFLLVQFFQPFHRGLTSLRRFFPAAIDRLAPTMQQWDGAVVGSYRRPGSMLWSFLSHLAGWMVGAAEVYLILLLLDAPVSWSTAFSIEALWVLLKSGAFLIPAYLGASEGALLLVCLGLGIPTVPGLAMALVRRARELLWLGTGLIEAVRWRTSFTGVNPQW